MNNIIVLDTTLRDGEQAPGNRLRSNHKVIIAKALEEAGVDIIDAGFPASNRDDFNSVQEISKSVNKSIVCALARAKENDIDLAVRALSKAKFKRIQTGICTSEIQLQTKLRISKDDAVDRAVRAVKYAKKHIEDIQFYAEDAGRSDKVFLARIIEQVIKAGATVINIPDTTGFCLPEEYAEISKFLFENVRGIHNVTVSTHCHNDLGLANANTIYGILHGARQIEVSVNGVGERAGNAALEEVVTTIRKKLSDNYKINIDLSKLFGLSSLVAELMNHPIPRNKPVVGENCFAHTSGIHQDGVIKSPLNYEIITPEEVGQESSRIILSDKSGRAALYYSFKKLGYNLEPEELNKIYAKFLSLFANRHSITDEDLINLIANKNPIING
jgi:2-isopropylmalate synthase